MINYCPEGTTNANVIEKCQEDTTGYLQAIPVHSQDTDLVYSNIFCALCHNDVNLTKTKGTVHCNNEDLLKTLKSSWTIIRNVFQIHGVFRIIKLIRNMSK